MSREKSPEYKPLLFTTTIRNPERMKDFIEILIPFNNMILDNNLINEIVYKLISKKIYVPIYIRKNSSLKSKLNTDLDFTNKEVELIIKNSPQNHKEAGFDPGWPSRFDTWYKFFKELGLIYYSMNEKLIISDAGLYLANSKNDGYSHLEQQVFLNSFVKYQRNNPYRKISNTNKPLILLIKTILELKNRIKDSKGISKREIPLLICWKDDNHKNLVDLIIEIRAKHGLNPSFEVIYDYCKKILEITTNDEKRFKIDTITNELPDEFIRKMRLTGLITLRGLGRYIDINTLENEKIDYILKNYSSNLFFENNISYFNYMKSLDLMLISPTRELKISNDDSSILFNKWVAEFDIDTLKNELLILTNKKSKSTNDVFKYISEPLRLEFLTALILQKKYSDIVVKANYIIDDEGLPTTFALGNSADIECYDKMGDALIEVTLLTGTQQLYREMPSIERHLSEKKETHINVFCIFVAPTIHDDTFRYAEFSKATKQLDIIPITIKDLVSKIDNIHTLREYLI